MSDRTQLVSGAGEALEEGQRRISRARQNIADASANAMDPRMVRDCLRDASLDLRRIEAWVEGEIKPLLQRTAGNAKRREDDLSATVARLATQVAELTDRLARVEAAREGRDDRDGPLRMIKG